MNPATANLDLFASNSGATFSDCRKYRYQLFREWDPDSTTCVFIGLNPSTADESVNDPTIRRCIQFAKDWGYGRLVMLNLFAYRSTDPSVLSSLPDPIGPENNFHILEICKTAGIVVAAWGNHGTLLNRHIGIVELLEQQVKLMCLKTTGSGQPIHPLYQPRTSVPSMYRG